jgi:hypothetical protein
MVFDAGETLAWLDAYLHGKTELDSEGVKVVRDTISAWFRDRRGASSSLSSAALAQQQGVLSGYRHSG